MVKEMSKPFETGSQFSGKRTKRGFGALRLDYLTFMTTSSSCASCWGMGTEVHALPVLTSHSSRTGDLLSAHFLLAHIPLQTELLGELGGLLGPTAQIILM